MFVMALAVMVAMLQDAVTEPEPVNPAVWVSDNDYPAEAKRAGWTGAVEFKLAVSPEGTVSECTIVKSSGHQLLDDRACEVISERAKFKPAHDAAGRAVASTWSSKFRWQLDDVNPGPFELGEPPVGPVYWKFDVLVDVDGTPLSCVAKDADGNVIPGDRGLCPSALKHKEPKVTKDGEPIRYHVIRTFQQTVKPDDN
ncbi:energy transducer TonB [Stakelama marina]|uniref:Energy transducer TonB n=1 Tax=Stakelama marina TaxID=2826939 RepID=A0A8T4IF81_9SPHN|nr:energy transducer TonB [Stakelama marina]MBR0551705.1 energy transducer TonB [Stakelama marina]